MKKENRNRIIGAIVGGSLVSATGYAIMAKLRFEKIFHRTSYITMDDNDDYFDEYTRNCFNQTVKRNLEWYATSKSENIQITSFDGIDLDGILIKNHDDHKYVVLSHGYNVDRFSMLEHAYQFDQQGYNVLMFDHRNCGKSAAKYNSMGWYEHIDLLQWIHQINLRDDKASIVLYGSSMGATTCLMAMGTKLTGVKAVIAEAPFSDLRSTITEELGDKTLFNPSFSVYGIDFFVEKYLGFKVDDLDVLKNINNSNIPLLLVYSKDDKVVPYLNSIRISDTYKGPHESLAYEQGLHGYLIYKQGYMNKLIDFINKY